MRLGELVVIKPLTCWEWWTDGRAPVLGKSAHNKFSYAEMLAILVNVVYVNNFSLYPYSEVIRYDFVDVFGQRLSIFSSDKCTEKLFINSNEFVQHV